LAFYIQLKEELKMRDNMIRFKQRGYTGRKDHYSFSRRRYERDIRRFG